MIQKEQIRQLAQRYQTVEYPTVVREYVQHLFLSRLYNQKGAEKILFKGGTALRILYRSPRFSEDLDFSLFHVPPHEQKDVIETHFLEVLSLIEQEGIKTKLGEKIGPTTDGYYGGALFFVGEYPPVEVVINVSSRNGRSIHGEIDSAYNDFIPEYTIVHLPKHDIVEEKIFHALLNRWKHRDFYDLYFLLRAGMVDAEQKRRLAEHTATIVGESKKKDFKSALREFLPQSFQPLLAEFHRALRDELERL